MSYTLYHSLYMPDTTNSAGERFSRLLTWLEGYAKTDLHYIARGGFWLSLGNGVVSITALLSSIAFAYFVPKEIFGTYQYILAMFGLLAVATLPKMNEAMMRAVAHGSEGEVYAALRERIRWGLLAGLGSLGLALYYYLQENTMLATCFLIIAPFVPFADPIGIFGDYLKAKRLFREASMYRIAARITTLVLTVPVIWYTQNLFVIVLTYFVLYTGIRAISHVIAFRLHPPNSERDEDSARYGRSLSLLAAFKAAVAQLDKVLIFHYLGAVELAVYFFATAPVDQIKNALNALSELAFPKFSRADDHSLKSTLLRKILRFEFLILVPMVVGYIVLIPYIFPLVFPQYAGGVWLTQIYGLSLLFFPTLILSTALVAQKKERELWISRTTFPFIRLAILVPAVQIWGLLGMVIGVVIVSALELIFNLVALYWPSRVTPTN